MGLFKRLAGLLGLGRDEDQHNEDEASIPASRSGASVEAAPYPAHLPRKGFSVAVPLPVERAPLPPLLVFCQDGDAGVQGLRWYARRLRIDEDGDVADEFLDEVSLETSMEDYNRPLPQFEVKYSTKPAKVKNQALLSNGIIQHLVEYDGRLEWV